MLKPFYLISIPGILLIILLAFSFKQHYPEKYVFPQVPYFPKMPAAKDNPVTNQGVELGRFLFYDPVLSRDSSFSCASCHKQEHAFADANKPFSTGISGQKLKRNTMPLFNLAWYEAYFWDGKAGSMEEQVFHPVRDHNEMDLNWTEAEKRLRRSTFYLRKFEAAFGDAVIDSTLIAKAIAQFERSLISHNSKYDRILRGEDYFTADEYKGFNLVNDQTKGDCLHCHTTDADALGTIGKFSNNGLDAVFNPDSFADKGKGGANGRTEDYGLFKIPSLRNLMLTAPYMHDGRFATLEEVLDFYSERVNNSYNIDSKMGFAHQGGLKLEKDEKEKIIAFLKTMTDSSFITNPEFGNPFKTKNNLKADIH